MLPTAAAGLVMPCAGPSSGSEDAAPPPAVAEPVADRAADLEAVERLIGRRPLAAFDVVVRRSSGAPVVIRNARSGRRPADAGTLTGWWTRS